LWHQFPLILPRFAGRLLVGFATDGLRFEINHRGNSVTKIFYSSVIPSPIDRVWARIRDFNKFPSWHPAVCNSSIEENRASDAVGCVRSLYLKSGGHFRERLLTLSDREYTFTFTILESPLPMTDYVSTIQLRPVTDTDQTYAQWTCEFNCAPDVESELMKTVLSVYQSGFDSLAHNVGVALPGP
jgi:hypothetical protein